MGVWIEETHVNDSENYLLAEPEEYESGYDEPGDLYRALLGEVGRCTSKVYVDREGEAVPVGWVFEKRDAYEDTGEPFKHVTWVTLLGGPSVIRRERTFLALDGQRIAA
jgi:hypothetical protein